jgi:hypothetical protein
VPATAAGGSLEVDLLATRSALAATAAAVPVRIGRLLRGHLAVGPVHFAVTADRRGRRALDRHGRLAVSIRLVLTPPHGQPATITRRLILRR